jgi:hypothetical protein
MPQIEACRNGYPVRLFLPLQVQSVAVRVSISYVDTISILLGPDLLCDLLNQHLPTARTILATKFLRPIAVLVPACACKTDLGFCGTQPAGMQGSSWRTHSPNPTGFDRATGSWSSHLGNSVVHPRDARLEGVLAVRFPRSRRSVLV